jgi:hypothetical protein
MHCCFWLFICLGFCSKAPFPQEALPYIHTFEINSHKIVQSDIFIEEFDERIRYKIAGECQFWGDGHREIHFNRNSWNNAGDLGKEQLMLHELGHCELNYDHNNNLLDGYRPKSIMYFQAFGDAIYYHLFHKEYFEEFFNREK